MHQNFIKTQPANIDKMHGEAIYTSLVVSEPIHKISCICMQWHINTFVDSRLVAILWAQRLV